MFKHILLPTDGSSVSMKAVKRGIDFAKSIDARVTALFVTLPYRQVMAEGYILPGSKLLEKRYTEEVTQQARKVLGAVEALAKRAGVPCKTVHVGAYAPYEAIVSGARRAKCDLIMMGSHGRGGLQTLLLGSETNKVLSHSRIPVLVYR